MTDIMIDTYLSEDFVANRIMKCLPKDGGDGTAAVLFWGYIAALLEWKVIEICDYDQLRELLPPFGILERFELLLGQRTSTEQEREVAEYVAEEGNVWKQKALERRRAYEKSIDYAVLGHLVTFSAYSDGPTLKELLYRVTKQLTYRGPTKEVVLIWKGYLYGLLEATLITKEAYDKVMKLLPEEVGKKELEEIFCLEVSKNL